MNKKTAASCTAVRILSEIEQFFFRQVQYIAYFKNEVERDTAVGNFNRAHVTTVYVEQLGKLHLSIAPVLAVVGDILPQFAIMPTVSLPTTVIIVFFIIALIFRMISCYYFYLYFYLLNYTLLHFATLSSAYGHIGRTNQAFTIL